MPSLADIRNNYAQQSLSEHDVSDNPISQFGVWWEEALESGIVEPNAMTLATASSDAVPSARIVLLKAFNESGFIFYTNYQSYKGQQLAENPKACLVFFWKELERQVRITGLVIKIDPSESDTYFSSRPVISQLSAIISPQSQVVESRQWLDEKYKDLESQLSQDQLKRPDHWGGYLVRPVVIEFWQGRPGRLHDRLQYSLQDDGVWKLERLAP